MRYIITQSQLHKMIYHYLNEMYDTTDIEKKVNPYNSDAYRISLKSSNGEIEYFWFGPGEDDGGNPHNGVGNLNVHPDVIDSLRNLFGVRQSKILDIIADWVSEKLDIDVDEISIYPERMKPPNY
jgi:hypothetical protein